MVATPEGNKPIENIKPGDTVYSYDENAGVVESKVVKTFTRTAQSLIDLTIKDEQGNESVITGTPEHPFFVPSVNGYVALEKLTPGTVLKTVDGSIVTVVCTKTKEGQFEVHNFEVAGQHNYYVSDKGVLVHNVCKMQADPAAEGPHTTFKVNQNGEITHYETWEPKANPHPNDPAKFRSVKRYDAVGKAHNGVSTPHVHEPSIPGGVRVPMPNEIP